MTDLGTEPGVSPENNGDNGADNSNPATEFVVVDNDSAFSGSSEIESVGKGEQANGNSNGDGPVADGAPQPMLVSAGNSEKPMSYRDYILKFNRIPQEEPMGWQSFSLPAIYCDPEDEFDVGTLRDPVYGPPADESQAGLFLNGCPTVNGDITSCFKESGILYRIVDRQQKIWAFYNDTVDFEVRVSCTFSKYSKMEALGKTTLTAAADDVTVAEVVVYPTETELFVKGLVNGFTSKFSAVPVSDAYLTEKRDADYKNVIEVEITKVKEHVGSGEDAAKVVATCVKYSIPFVDLEFPPVQSSICYREQKDLRVFSWSRPRMFVKSWMVDQLRLFRSPITPGDVRHGELGNCWLMCAIATMAEMPHELVRMFRHPYSAARARDERAVGGYRLTVNKNGLWSSVIVDDYLPTIAGVPTFGRSVDPCELWPSIFEKAYAKLHGSYSRIRSGDPVHALTDMSGCPAMRIDDDFANAFQDSGKKLFDLLRRCYEGGYQIILTVSGTVRAAVPENGESGTPRTASTDLRSLTEEVGLVSGYAYTVTAVHSFPQRVDVQLLRIRNVWGKRENWKGPWSPGSPEWSKYPDVAEACNPQLYEESDIWMDWWTVLRYFNGGGVHFYIPGYDYRVPIVFGDCRPSLVLEVSVLKPVRLCFTLSAVDYRVLSDDVNTCAARYDYPPMMVSLSSGDGQEEGMHRVIQNTNMNAAEPSLSEWTFVRAREIGMVCHLTPEQSPYLVIPRMLELEDTVAGSSAWYTRLRDKIHSSHFANAAKGTANAAGASESAAEIPVVLGVRCPEPLGTEDGCGVCVDFKYLNGSNVVFENYPRFPNETTPMDDVFHQKRVPTQGFVEELSGASMC